ncbi:Protein C35B8.3 a [Aphelenchoides avenae]|nr:Protein C35B8.3 a [Aphelenchus avenae]
MQTRYEPLAAKARHISVGFGSKDGPVGDGRELANSHVAKRSIPETLSKIREDAIHRTENARKTTELLDDEIEYLKRKTGASMVKWTISWDQAYLRRCLMNVQHMIRQADRDMYEAIIHALNNHKLIFGRGTFICCDGSVQFGADEVPETWQKVCIEANVRRFELRNLELLMERVRDLFGTTHLVVDPLGHLLRNIQHLQSIIVRVSSRPKAETTEVLQLAKDAVIEIVSAYSELNVTRDGRLQIPCNVDLQSLKDFLVANSQRSQSMYSDMRRKKDDIQYLRTQCIKTMELTGLDWDSDLGPDLLLDCLNRLKNVNADTADTLRGLSVLLSTNPNVYVTNSGKISVPIDCL